jgi:hypothetical protein
MIFRRACLCLGGAFFALTTFAATVTPFADNNGKIPPSTDYAGPLFKGSYKYPATAPVPAMPWRAAINNGLITTQNAAVYTQALKDSVARDMRVLLFDYANWNAAQRGWYNEPWMGSEREAIHGMYVAASSLDTSLFTRSGLAKPITTYALTYYDRTAAQTLNRIWGATAMNPVVDAKSTQFPEGSLIVKAAFITADASVWPAMTGSQAWPAYITTNATTGQFDKPTVFNTYLMQLDIIVKDSKSAPQTGWVFTTLVYDKNVRPGSQGIWDQMVVLGAQWGNDPQANSKLAPGALLVENWNNPAAPGYATETLGWGERLSGPNDGAMNDLSFVEDGKRQFVKNGKDSSCMSCHSTAQWNVKDPAKGMVSFLLPLVPPVPSASAAPLGGQPYLNSPAPGSADWMRWFQNRKGDVPMDPGSVAADFDMVLTFKTLPAWFKATTGKTHALSATDRTGKHVVRDYSGKPVE